MIDVREDGRIGLLVVFSSPVVMYLPRLNEQVSGLGSGLYFILVEQEIWIVERMVCITRENNIYLA